MTSYNSINNTQSSNNYEFLTTILREEWKWNINETGEDASIVVQVDVKNTGKRTGKTVAQLYVSDLVKQVEMPSKQLKGFRRLIYRENILKRKY